MRHRQQLFLSINRIILLLYAPLSIALAVYYLFTGSLLHSILALFTLFWMFLPHMVHHLLHLRPGQLMLFFYCSLILLGYSGGLVLSLGKRFPWYDECIHAYAGFFFCLLAAAMFCLFTKKRTNRMNRNFCYIFCISFSLAVFLLWEAFQLIIDAGIMKHSFELSSVILDCTAWTIGVAAIIICLLMDSYQHIHAYPLYALEDYACLNIKSTVEILK